MSQKEEFDVKLDGELTSKHLLALILELNGIRESEAERKLQVGAELVHEWRIELQNAGLIEIDEYLTDPQMRITKLGLKEVKTIEAGWLSQSEDGEKKEDPMHEKMDKFKAQLRGIPQESSMKVKKFGREGGMDVLIVVSVFVSLYMLNTFIQDPNVEVFSFLIGMSILAFAVMLYNRYKQALKTREFIGFVRWLFLEIKTYRQYIEITIVVLLLIYVMGLYLLTRDNLGIYIILSVMVASTGQLIFSPKKTVVQVLKFYFGVLMLTGGLVLSVGMVSLTERFLEKPVRLLDLLFGIGMLFIASMNERELGLSIARKNP